jgi:hypothetical protein
MLPDSSLAPTATATPAPQSTTPVCGVGEYLVGDGVCAYCAAGQYQVRQKTGTLLLRFSLPFFYPFYLSTCCAAFIRTKPLCEPRTATFF